MRTHHEYLTPDECGECGRDMPWDTTDATEEGVVPLCRRCWWRLCRSPTARLRNWWHARKEPRP